MPKANFLTETKICSKCREEKPISAFSPVGRMDIFNRDGLWPYCKECRNTKFREERAKKSLLHPPKPKLSDEEKRENAREWRSRNKEKISEKFARWRVDNKEKISARQSDWFQKNKGRVAEYRTRRKRMMFQQTPKWADIRAMQKIYADRDEFRSAGINASVDHIVPLRGVLVCGLHCEHNLTIKLFGHNSGKGARFDPNEFDPDFPLGK